MSKKKTTVIIVSLLISVVTAAGAVFAVRAMAADTMAVRTPVRILHNPVVTWAEPEAEKIDSTEGEWTAIEPGMKLKVDGYVRTGSYGAVDISFSEGTLLRIAEDTLVSLTDLTLSRVGLSLEKGSLISRFRKVTGREIHRITTPELTCGIRGTELALEIGPGKTTVYGLSGVTTVASLLHPDRPVLLGFQRKTTVPDGEEPEAPVDMTEEEIDRYRRILDAMHESEVFFITSDLNFKPNSTDLDDESWAVLEELAPTMKRKRLKIEIVGHTADVGDQSKQYELSARRAEAIKEALVSMGVRESHLTTAAFGGLKPVASNDTPEGRALNRRVEFLIKE